MEIYELPNDINLYITDFTFLSLPTVLDYVEDNISEFRSKIIWKNNFARTYYYYIGKELRLCKDASKTGIVIYQIMKRHHEKLRHDVLKSIFGDDIMYYIAKDIFIHSRESMVCKAIMAYTFIIKRSYEWYKEDKSLKKVNPFCFSYSYSPLKPYYSHREYAVELLIHDMRKIRKRIYQNKNEEARIKNKRTRLESLNEYEKQFIELCDRQEHKDSFFYADLQDSISYT